VRKGAVTCNHLPIAAVTDTTSSYYLGKYLESYKAFSVKSVNSIHVALILSNLKRVELFDGVARGSSLKRHVTKEMGTHPLEECSSGG
jgi:hypothetical protein